MTPHLGRILRLDRGRALVRVKRQSCEGCAGACSMFARRETDLWIDVAPGLRVGDEVRVTAQPEDLLSASLYLYGAPLAGLLGGILIGGMLVGDMTSDMGAVLGGAVGMFSALMWQLRQQPKTKVFACHQ